MNKNEQIGSFGAVSLITTLITTKILISAPSLYAKQSLGAGWLEVLLSGIFEILVLAIVLKLALSFDNIDLIDISEAAFGAFGRVVTGIISIIILTVNTAAIFRCYAELIRNTVIKGISYETVGLILLIISIASACSGLKTQINLNTLTIPFVLITLIVVGLINYSRYAVTNILPFSGPGFSTVVSNALLKNSTYFELGIILFLIPYLGKKPAVKKIGFTALVLSTALSSLLTLFYQLSLPYEAAGTFALPLYQMTRMIKAGTFFQRIEPLNVFIWSGAMFIYIGIGIWLSAHLFKKSFHVSASKPMVFIISFIVMVLAFIPGSEASVEKIYNFLMTYSYIAYPILPLILLVAASAYKRVSDGV